MRERAFDEVLYLISCFLVAWAFVMLVGIAPATAQEEDRCDVESVVQPAIDDAAIENGCNAEGAYISPQELAAKAADNCLGLQGRKCQRCLNLQAERSSKALKLLIQQRFFPSHSMLDLKRAFDATRALGCAQPGEGEPPSSEPSSSVSSSSSSAPPSSEPSSSPASSSSSSGASSSAPSFDEAVQRMRETVQAVCPCELFNTRQETMRCVGPLLTNALNEGKINRDVALVIYQEIDRSQCWLQ